MVRPVHRGRERPPRVPTPPESAAPTAAAAAGATLRHGANPGATPPPLALLRVRVVDDDVAKGGDRLDEAVGGEHRRVSGQAVVVADAGGEVDGDIGRACRGCRLVVARRVVSLLKQRPRTRHVVGGGRDAGVHVGEWGAAAAARLPSRRLPGANLSTCHGRRYAALRRPAELLPTATAAAATAAAHDMLAS